MITHYINIPIIIIYSPIVSIVSHSIAINAKLHNSWGKIRIPYPFHIFLLYGWLNPANIMFPFKICHVYPYLVILSPQKLPTRFVMKHVPVSRKSSQGGAPSYYLVYKHHSV